MATSLFESISGSCASGKGKSNHRGKPIVTGHMISVEKKLRRMPEYRNETPNYIRMLARELSSPQEIAKKQFSSITHHLIGLTIKKHLRDVAEKNVTPHQQTINQMESAKRVDEVAKFEVKLMLRYVDSQVQPDIVGRVAAALNMEYGPLHAYLLINDHILVEWCDNSVIIPRIVDPDEDSVKLASAIVQDIPKGKCTVTGPYHMEDETELVFQASEHKLKLVKKLASVIALYNTTYTYNPIFRNCQKFVSDVLDELGCKDKPKFSEGMQKYFKHLRERGKVLVEFESHDELDRYVQDNASTLSTHNVEYLLTQYFLFHHRAFIRANMPKHWQCPSPQCMADFLEIKIKEETLVMSQFLHIKHV